MITCFFRQMKSQAIYLLIKKKKILKPKATRHMINAFRINPGLFFALKMYFGASLVAQWLRICLPMQGTWVRARVWEDPTSRGATRPVSHNYWACASGACAPQQERPRQWKARAPRWRVDLLAATRESPCTEMKTQHSQK